jgi:hypothetical protein
MRTSYRRVVLGAGVLAAGWLLSAGALSAPALAQDDAAAQRAKAQVKFFDQHVGKSRDPGAFARLVDEMCTEQHPVVAERLGRVLARDKDTERQMIAGSKLAEFTKNPAAREAAGEVLRKALEKRGGFDDDVVDTMTDSVGKLGHAPAVPVLCEMLKKGGDPYLLVTAVRSVGRIGDKRALPTLLELWERHPVGYSWETGEVTVDTGASGDEDQRAAEAQWNAQYGSVGPKGKPPVMLKLYIQELVRSIGKITGDETINKPAMLRKWMEARAAELKALGVEIPKYRGPRRKDPDAE